MLFEGPKTVLRALGHDENQVRLREAEVRDAYRPKVRLRTDPDDRSRDATENKRVKAEGSARVRSQHLRPFLSMIAPFVLDGVRRRCRRLARLRGFAVFQGGRSLFINELNEKVFTVRQAKLALSNR
jgi:hypothetical protein